MRYNLHDLFKRPRHLIFGAVGLGVLLLLTATTIGVMLLRAPKPVAIDVATDPSSAEVFVDGQSVGNTPLTTAVPEGEHTLVLRKSGFVTIERKVFADRSAPRGNNDFSFGLEPDVATSVPKQRSTLVAKLKQQAQDAYRRGDLVAPEKDNALYYIEQLAIISPTEPIIGEMRERIRQALKQRAEAARPRNDLA